jgi:uncharacterized protein (DUF362 family)
MDRRDFIRTVALGTGGYILGFHAFRLFAQADRADLVIVRNGAPGQMARKAVELLGGMTRYVKAGQTVVVKPNIGWDRAPEFAANTNPEVAAEVVKMCYEAGAKQVISFDRPCNEARRCYINSGLEKAMSDAGASVRFVRDQLFVPVAIKDGFAIQEWDFYRDALDADVLINIPIMKSHSVSRVTLGLKNMMGVIGGNRGKIHWSFDQKIADINRVIRPQLTIIDAVRILRRNGPSGGDLKDVETLNTIIAGVDPVLVDAWGTKLFGVDPGTVGWLEFAEKAGLGTRNVIDNLPLEYTFVD